MSIQTKKRSFKQKTDSLKNIVLILIFKLSWVLINHIRSSNQHLLNVLSPFAATTVWNMFHCWKFHPVSLFNSVMFALQRYFGLSNSYNFICQFNDVKMSLLFHRHYFWPCVIFSWHQLPVVFRWVVAGAVFFFCNKICNKICNHTRSEARLEFGCFFLSFISPVIIFLFSYNLLIYICNR